MRALPAALAALAALLVVGSAVAGGVPVEVNLAGRSAWAVSDNGLNVVDTRTGRSAQLLTPYPFATRLAVMGNSIYVASIASGYTGGAVSQIDLRTRRAKTILKLPHEPVWDVCAGGGAAWAMYGRGGRARVVQLGARRHESALALPAQPSWCAADSSGVWITDAAGRVLHSASDARRLTLAARISGAFTLTTANGSVWIAAGRHIAQLDERTRRVSFIRVGLAVDAIAVSKDALFVIARTRAGRNELLRISRETERVTTRRLLRGAPHDIRTSAEGLWLGGLDTKNAPTLWSVDPATLDLRRVASLGP